MKAGFSPGAGRLSRPSVHDRWFIDGKFPIRMPYSPSWLHLLLLCPFHDFHLAPAQEEEDLPSFPPQLLHFFCPSSSSSACSPSPSVMFPPSTFLLPILLFFLLCAATGAARSELRTTTTTAAVAVVPDQCKGRRIHVRQLPPRFNEELLRNCSAYYPLCYNLCPYLSNGALGEKTHNRSRSWYRIDPSVLEPLFHCRLLEYPCLTPDPSSTDAVFLPYYAALDALRYLYGPDVNSYEHGLDLYGFLVRDNPGIWARHSGHDHLLVMAGPAWDFSQDPAADKRWEGHQRRVSEGPQSAYEA